MKMNMKREEEKREQVDELRRRRAAEGAERVR